MRSFLWWYWAIELKDFQLIVETIPSDLYPFLIVSLGLSFVTIILLRSDQQIEPDPFL